MQVLVVTNSYDTLHVQAVSREIERLGGNLIRFDVDLVVTGQNQITLTYTKGSMSVSLSTKQWTVEPDDIDAVWFRKPFGFGNFGFVETITDQAQRKALKAELTATIRSLSVILGDKVRLNSLAAIDRAKLKPWQLAAAQSAGLNVPDTIITNEPEAARMFCDVTPTVFKPLEAPALRYNDRTFALDTRLLTESHVNQLDLIARQPTLLQAYVDKSCELRVTYVCGQLFIARQELAADTTAYPADWRILQGTPASTYTQGELTKETTHKISRLMHNMGLMFGALDFAVDQDGKEFFLEVNPNGQWLAYTDTIGLPCAAAIARSLTLINDD